MFLLQRSTHATDWTWTSSTAYSHPLCTAKHLWAPVLWAKMTVVRARTQFSQLSIRDTRSRQMSLGDFASSGLNSSWRLLKAAWRGVLSISKKQCPTASAGTCPSVLTTPVVNTFFHLVSIGIFPAARWSCCLLFFHSVPFVHLSLPSLITLH